MKHKRIASALLAAMIIVTSASNSIFPVSAKDLDVQNQEVSELSEEGNDVIAEENEMQNDSQENDASENDQESNANTENGGSESDQDTNGGADNGDAEPGQDGSGDEAGNDTTNPDQDSSDAADNNTAEPGQDINDAVDNNTAESGQNTSDIVDNTTETPDQDVIADTENTAADEIVITDEITEEDAEEEPSEGVAEAAEAEYFDRYSWQPSGDAVALAAETGDDIDVTADIRKRAEWTDETNGDGKITLEYKATMGNKTALKDMNVVLVQDKSGSMDSNYGYNLERVRQGWSTRADSKFYPARLFGSDGKTVWTESIEWLSGKGNDYFNFLNKNLSGYSGFRKDGNDTYLTNGEMNYNSPCQVKDHYYLTIKEDTTSNIPAWTMVSGRSLYNISSTDLHHYVKIKVTDKKEYLNYTQDNRRVVKLNPGDKYCDESGEVKKATEEMYFLDVTHLDNYNGSWILSTCGEEECQKNDRLAKSQEFMISIVNHIKSLNPNNKIAYVPFWGDVPNNGTWSNASSKNGSGLYADNEGRLTEHEGVTKLDFTSDYDVIKNQISNSFTYDGTNWSRAFYNTSQLIQNSQETNSKDTLVIFLTDGMPQGTAGKPEDYNNPEIDGTTQINALRNIQGVTIYACGVGVNESDTTGLATRLNNIDSTKKAVYARNTDEFETLQKTILDRIDSQYKITVKGENAFYKDVIDTDNFVINEEKIANAPLWKILETGGANNETYQVPQNVYDAAKNGAEYIYVRDTHTVYWAIGDLDPAGYNAGGHSVSFPIKYKNYTTVTEGDISLKSNTEQKLTYNTTLGDKRTVETAIPQIVFNRPLASVTITKNVSGANFTEDKTFKFAYTTTQQTGSTVQSPLGTVTVTVPEGQTSGIGTISELSAGTYYVYEVDNQGNKISAEEQIITVTETPEIRTEPKSSTVPASATASDKEDLANANNVLRITLQRNDVSFTNEYVKVNVTKTWSDEGYTQRPASVTIELLRNGEKIDSMELSDANNWQGSFENLEKKDASGRAYAYTINEVEIPGYVTTISDPTINGNEYSYTVTNTLLRGSITIQKKDGNGKDLEDATFELKNAAGKIVQTVTSGSDGKVEFKDLLPDTYTITETKTPSGHMLLKDPIEVTIPMKLTEQQVNDQKVDKNKCKIYTENGENVYWVYDFTYEITNGMSFDIPIAGGVITVQMYVPLIAGILLLCVAAALLLRKKKDHPEA